MSKGGFIGWFVGIIVSLIIIGVLSIFFTVPAYLGAILGFGFSLIGYLIGMD